MEAVHVHFSVTGKLNCGVCGKVGLSRLDKHLADLHQLRPDRDPPCDEDLNSGTPHTPASQRDSSCDEDMALELEESDSEEPEVGRPLKRRVVKRKLSFSGPVVEKSGVGLSRLDKHLADLHQLRPDRDPPCDEDLNSGTPHTPASQRDSSCDEDMALELEESDSEEPEVGRPLKRQVVKRKLSFAGAGGGKKRGYYRPNAARHKVQRSQEDGGCYDR
ncbi:hypothetical protein N1851_011267 [Merluccius polli]|uniref:Uncharacterized protein n=1 Tax=Merluccius polli TaxID=89951 RepID=A0AA47MXF4_MERPO|nr:hypothetical protein N1851_011267 [Merluccius polli]